MKEGSTEIKSKNIISLDNAIEDYFCIARNLKNFSSATISSYAVDFRQFKEFLERNGDSGNDIAAITPAQIEEFCMVLIKERGISINSAHRKKDALSSLFKHSEKRGWLEKNPVARVELARKKKNTRQVFLNERQVKEFIAADARIKGYDASTLAAVKKTLCFTGIRNSELRRLNWKHIDFQRNVIRIYDSKNTNRKGHPDNLDREIPICTCLRNSLKEIEAVEGPVFKNSDGKAITKDALLSLVKRSSISAELKISVTPHSIRHTLASNLEKIGATRSDIAFLLGHKHATVTDGYVHTNIDRITNLLETYSVNVMDEKLDSIAEEGSYEVKPKDEFYNQEETSCIHKEQLEIGNEQEQSGIIINSHIINKAERAWNQIYGDKVMPANFLLGYIMQGIHTSSIY